MFCLKLENTSTKALKKGKKDKNKIQITLIMTNYYPVSSSSLPNSRNTETFCMHLNYGRKIYVDSINYLVTKSNFYMPVSTICHNYNFLYTHTV